MVIFIIINLILQINYYKFEIIFLYYTSHILFLTIYRKKTIFIGYL